MMKILMLEAGHGTYGMYEKNTRSVKPLAAIRW